MPCNSNCEISKTVTIDQPIFKSFCGKYFLGKTDFVYFGDGTNAWAGLINPVNSGVNLYVSVFTISNLTEIPFLAQIWFNPTPPGGGSISKQVSISNTTFNPTLKPKVKIAFQSSTSNILNDGINVYDRIVPGKSTIASDENGKFIMPPGGSFLIFLPSQGSDIIKTELAFGWWEQRC